jgi:hypothetical protein
MDYARQVNPKIHILQISATTGEGMDKWYMWLKAQISSITARIFKWFIFTFGNRQNSHLAIFTQIKCCRTNKITHIFNK